MDGGVRCCVDRSEPSRDFFVHTQAVLDLVSKRRKYRQQPFVRFV